MAKTSQINGHYHTYEKGGRSQGEVHSHEHDHTESDITDLDHTISREVYKYKSGHEVYFRGTWGLMGPFTDQAGVNGCTITHAGNSFGWIDIGFMLRNLTSTTITVEIWYVRENAVSDDAITVRYYGAFHNDGDAMGYNVANNLTSAETLLQGSLVGKIEFDITDADLTGSGLLSLWLKFENLADNDNRFIGVGIISQETV